MMPKKWDEVYKGLKKTGMAGAIPLSKNEQSNITPKLTKFIFESGQRCPGDASSKEDLGRRKGVGEAIQTIQAEMSKLKRGSERWKGMQKALAAVQKIADPPDA